MGAGAPIKAGIKFVKSGLDDVFDYAGEAIDALGNKIGALPDANAVLTKPKPTATELRRQANIDRFGYDPNDVPDAPVRTPTDDAGFESYLEQVNPNFKRIAAEDRPNLMMGDMYGMLPRNSEVIRYENGVTFHRAPNGDHYATAFNPDLNEEDVVGYITNRGDGTELAVTQEMQGQGIGGELQYMFRKENPNAATGGLTEAGEKSLQRTYNRLSEEGIAKDAQEAVPALSPQINPTQTGFIFKDVKPIGPLLSKFENRRLSSGMAQPEVTILPIRSMYASQPSVNPDFSTTESSSGSLPLVIKKNNELFVSDGHHRLTKLASEGEQNARVRLIDFDEPTDTPLLNYNPNQTAEDDALLEQLFGALPKDTE